jgi:hypothetical protein
VQRGQPPARQREPPLERVREPARVLAPVRQGPQPVLAPVPWSLWSSSWWSQRVLEFAPRQGR